MVLYSRNDINSIDENPSKKNNIINQIVRYLRKQEKSDISSKLYKQLDKSNVEIKNEIETLQNNINNLSDGDIKDIYKNLGGQSASTTRRAQAIEYINKYNLSIIDILTNLDTNTKNQVKETNKLLNVATKILENEEKNDKLIHPFVEEKKEIQQDELKIPQENEDNEHERIFGLINYVFDYTVELKNINKQQEIFEYIIDKLHKNISIFDKNKQEQLLNPLFNFEENPIETDNTLLAIDTRKNSPDFPIINENNNVELVIDDKIIPIRGNQKIDLILNNEVVPIVKIKKTPSFEEEKISEETLREFENKIKNVSKRNISPFQHQAHLKIIDKNDIANILDKLEEPNNELLQRIPLIERNIQKCLGLI
jgi:hypothetical protein